MDEMYTKSNCLKKSSTPLSRVSTPALDGVLFIPTMKRYNRLRQQDIGYIKGDKSYVLLYLVDGQKLAVSTHLGHFMRYLDPHWFMQTSRSHIVNLAHVEVVTTRSVVVNGKAIPLTEAHRTTLWDRLPIVRLKSD